MDVEKSIRIDKKGIVHMLFLRQSRREGQKLIKTTILNITNWGEQNCEAFAALLKNKKLLSQVAENLANPVAAN
jgi:wyosine [tRNA(Phe)-imidazoG37] synthetase (radical SAM superfamily)